MSISDRNLIRKILLTIFPEPLIKAGGRKLIHYTKYKFCYQDIKNLKEEKKVKGIINFIW